MASVKFFDSVEENGIRTVRLEVLGCTHGRPHDSNSLTWQQVTLTVENNIIKPEFHWRFGHTFDTFHPFLDWPSRHSHSWATVLLQENYNDPSDDIFGSGQIGEAASRWYAYDTRHQDIVWEKWFDKPLNGGSTRSVGFRLLKQWVTNTEVEGEHDVQYLLEYNKNTPKKKKWIQLAYPCSLQEMVCNIIPMQSLHACPAGSNERVVMIEELKTLCPEWAQSKYAYRLEEQWGMDKSINDERYPVQDHYDPLAILEPDELSDENRSLI